MDFHTIRQTFLNYFQKKGHTVVPAAPLVNREDPDLLFTIAGMNPFKNIFLGNQAPTHKEITNSQPCLRVTGKHNDLEEVGTDTYHHTLFEMLGNWSFGSYFKKEAIAWAWELLTKDYAIDPERLYATVFEGDQSKELTADKESLVLWKNHLPSSHILYSSKKHNFWEMGTTGPCGPCTEIHIDLRSNKARQGLPGWQLINTGHPQIIELWNIVFIQYNKNIDNTLTPLDEHHVDTGMGLERLAMVLQHKRSTYATDAFMPLITSIAHITQVHYRKSNTTDTALRIIADHIRAITFAIAEGAYPSNQKEGYVVRRILRRALRYGYTHLNLQQPFLYQLVPQVIQTLSKAYPSLAQQQDLIQKSIYQEEISFINTLGHGINKFTHIIAQLPQNTTTIDGATVFELYDTYGFPPDLTALMAREQGLTIDEEGFNQAMEVQRTRSKKTPSLQQGQWQTIAPHPTSSTFVGYDHLETTAHLVRYRKVQNKATTHYELILTKTPFYAESGGQIGDIGYITTPTQKIKVLDTQKFDHEIIHHTSMLPQDLHAPLLCTVDSTRRANITKNHTATHLMFAAMTQKIGNHITQQGSLVHEKGLRFDFTHHEKVSSTLLREIEELVNEQIRADIPLEEIRETTMEQAKKIGATAAFEEKYGEKVRVVKYGNYCADLCGGTHVQATGAIGFFKIQAEKGVCTGIRRIEAITGIAAEKWVQEQQDLLHSIGEELKNTQNPLKATTQLITKHKELNRQRDSLMQKIVSQQKKEVKAKLQQVKNIYVGIMKIEVETPENLKKIAFSLAKNHQPLFLVLATTLIDKAHLMIYISPNLTDRFRAHELLETLSPHIKGKGGGNSQFAIAIGDHTDGIATVLQVAWSLFEEKVSIKNCH